TAMGEDDIGIEACLELLEPGLDLGRLGGKETVAKGQRLDLRARDVGQEVRRRGPRLRLARAAGRQHAPVHVEDRAGPLPLKNGGTRADLDVVGVGAEAQHREALARYGQLEGLHFAFSTSACRASFGCQGMSPRCTMSSSVCLSLRVSMARKKPSWR